MTRRARVIRAAARTLGALLVSGSGCYSGIGDGAGQGEAGNADDAAGSDGDAGGTGDPSAPVDPEVLERVAPSGMRRLTAFEYASTVRDLLGVDVPANLLLPEDPRQRSSRPTWGGGGGASGRHR